jgi:curved DNA-binding protein
MGEHSDFFGALFRQARANQWASGGSSTRGQRVHAKGRNSHAQIQITLAEAYHGGSRKLTPQMPGMDDQGHVVLREHPIEFNIPRGARAGQCIRLAGQGGPGMGQGLGACAAEGASAVTRDKPVSHGAASCAQGPTLGFSVSPRDPRFSRISLRCLLPRRLLAGDLFLEVAFQTHKHYRVDKHGVYLEVPVAPWEAALGTTIEGPTPSGTVGLTVLAGSGEGRKLRLQGRGIAAKTPGDFYFVLKRAQLGATP